MNSATHKRDYLRLAITQILALSSHCGTPNANNRNSMLTVLPLGKKKGLECSPDALGNCPAREGAMLELWYLPEEQLRI